MRTPLNGFISLHRKMLNWGWYDDTNTKVVFIHLLLVANFTDNEWHGIKVPRGSVITSVRSLATELKLSDQKVRTALEHLKSTGEITSKGHSKFTIISIKNYDLYQTPNEQNNEQITSNQRGSNEEATNKQQQRNNVNKDNNDNKVINNSLSSVSTSEEASVDFNSVIDLFNSVCKSLENVSGLTKTRQRNILKANDVLNGDFNSLFRRIESSDFLTGKKGDWNGATFDWIFTPKNLEKILAGNYDNKEEFKNGRHSSFSDEDIEFLKTLGDNY